MKRLPALLLSVLMLASVLGVAAGAEGTTPFADISTLSQDDQDAIQYMYDTGLMEGVSDTEFGPELPYTRAMFVTMLGRMEGIDALDYPGSAFRDVAIGNWATPYINWASSRGIVDGIGDGMFAPGDIITEEQYCTIVCRYLNAKGIDFPGAPVWKPEIADAFTISTWALPYVIEMVDYNLVGLTYDRFFLPQEELDRMSIARYFTDLHIMLQEGVCPAEVYEPASELNLTGDEIVAITSEAAAYLGNWFCFNSYCDSGQTVENGYGVFEKVINPYYSTKQQVVEQGYRYYLFDVSQQMEEEKAFLEEDGSLYLSAADGLGGFEIDRARIDISTEDAAYILTYTYYNGDEIVYTQETRLFYDGQMGRWVFTDLIYPGLATIELELAWG